MRAITVSLTSSTGTTGEEAVRYGAVSGVTSVSGSSTTGRPLLPGKPAALRSDIRVWGSAPATTE